MDKSGRRRGGHGDHRARQWSGYEEGQAGGLGSWTRVGIGRYHGSRRLCPGVLAVGGQEGGMQVQDKLKTFAPCISGPGWGG